MEDLLRAKDKEDIQTRQKLIERHQKAIEKAEKQFSTIMYDAGILGALWILFIIKKD